MQGTLHGGHSQLHRTRGAGAGDEGQIPHRLQPGLRLVVCWGHLLRDGRWTTSIHGREQRLYPIQGMKHLLYLCLAASLNIPFFLLADYELEGQSQHSKGGRTL